MNAVLLLLGFPIAFGIVDEDYKGFYNCGQDGWSCRSNEGNYEVTYTCTPTDSEARVWIWSARFPSKTSIFTVRDCNHLEVHVDCTSGLRSSILKQFNVFNVKNLEILQPTAKGRYLHDNEQSPQLPSTVHIENVQQISLYAGLFDKPSLRCSNKLVSLSNLTIINVRVDKIPANLFHDQNLNRLILKNVVVDSVESNAMSIIMSNGMVTGSKFPDLPFNAIQMKSRGKLTFTNNTFEKIQSHGLVIRSREFLFGGNRVEEIGSEGMDVLGSKIEISKNYLNHMDGRALEKISFSYASLNFEMATKFLYNFSDNYLVNLNPGSLHPNWFFVKELCGDVVVKNNKFACSCVNFGWVIMANGMGPKISKFKEFYDRYLVTNDNVCIENDGCSIETVVRRMQDICSNKTSTRNVCESSLNATGETQITTAASSLQEEAGKSEAPSRQMESTTEIIGQTHFTYAQEEKTNVPLWSYSETIARTGHQKNFNFWFISIPLIVVLAVGFIGLLIWWYRKRNKDRSVRTLYKTQKNNDSDSLIIINERSNELYNDRNETALKL